MDVSRVKKLLIRGLKLKCPACGQTALFESAFKMRERCFDCDLIFSREQGYFVGAIYVNVVATESLILLVYLSLLLILPASSEMLYIALFALALILPLAFFHHARSLWLSLDHIIDPPDRNPGPSDAS